MKRPSKQATATLALSFLILLERFAYYGVRGIIVLYFLESLGLDDEAISVADISSIWQNSYVFICILCSLLTDFFIGQRKSIFLGGVLVLLAYVTFQLQGQYMLYAGFVLLLVGTSFIKPSMTILVGRQFKKENRSRALAMMVFFMFINIGAFWGTLGVGYVSETISWRLGLHLVCGAMVLYLILAMVWRKHLVENESNTLESTNTKIWLKRSIWILLFLTFIELVHQSVIEIQSAQINELISKTVDTYLFHWNIPELSIELLNDHWYLIICIMLLLIWGARGVPSLFKMIMIAFALLAASQIALYFMPQFPVHQQIEFGTFTLFIIAFSEAIYSAILISFVTRVADIRYSTTIYSCFIAIVFLSTNYLTDHLKETGILILLGFVILVILSSTSILKKWSSGLD